MAGHGWVRPNPDGSRARCGGPSVCSACTQELGARIVQERPEVRVARDGETHLFFDGASKVYFLAYCMDCWPDKFAPMPFGTADDRDKWAAQHATVGHNISFLLEVRS
jgi:hypothetical protein